MKKTGAQTTAEFLRRTLTYLKPYHLLAALNLLFSMLTIGFYFAFPQITQHIIDDAIEGKNLALLQPSVLLLLGAFVLCGVSNSLRIIVNTRFGQHVIFDMRCAVYRKLQRLPVGYFDNRASGDIMTRVIEDVAAVHRVLIDGFERAVTTLLSIVVIFVILLFKNVTLTMLALLPLSLSVAGALWYTLTARSRYRIQRKAIGDMNAMLMDNLQGIRQIKTFVRQEHENRRFAAQAGELKRSTCRVMDIWALYSPAMTFAGSIGMVLVLWAGGPMVIEGKISLGELVGFIFYLTLFYEPVSRIDGLNQMLQSARAAYERVYEILDAEDEKPWSGRSENLKTPVRGEVRYEGVSFGYREGLPVLKNISLSAKPGETVALAGPTGSGKTTLVNLLAAFYRPTSGRITLDGADIAGLPPDTLRNELSIVSQEPFLFNGTVRENILYGRPEASEEEMRKAAMNANCHQFVESLPEGYSSRVGERGVKLSTGEKQRISIARALLKNAPILILDEATASVDTGTEQLIQEALQRLMKNRTCFVIAHRLKTIRNSDTILVMHHGEIIERGTHSELLGQGGMYARLCLVGEAGLDERLVQE
ncbi:MAG: ABC transporter ATP-binding protein [Chlorobiaceae bacterium]|nr:ABC transporter ATP-binding protein [Chlorobiaceae bacterium]